MNDLISMGKAARILGVHVNTIRRWSDTGAIPTLRLPNSRGDRRVHRADIEAMLTPSLTKKG